MTAPAASRKPVILAVDDDPAVSRAVARDLRRHYGERYRIVRAESGYASPAGAAGRYADWAAEARSARAAAEQLAEIWSDSELLAEPHPTREQLFRGTGIDGLGGPGQTRFPRRHPLGVAG